MRNRNMKTGEERDFIQGMKIDDLWKPIQRLRTGGRSTVQITEIHPEDVKADLPKTIMGEDKAPEKKSRRKEARSKAAKATDAEITS